MIAFCQCVLRVLCLSLIGLASQAGAAPVVYTLQTVADGKLGNHMLSEALVTFVMNSDTAHVTSNGTRWENHAGSVELHVSQNGRTTVAHFYPGQVYVYYDTATGIAGFGSAISPSYPISLDCADYFAPPASVNYTH